MYSHLITNIKALFFLSVLFIILCSCTTATKTLILSEAKLPAILQPAKDLYILKIDKKMVKVNPQKTSGTKYCRVAIDPGIHKVVVHIHWFDEGSVFFLNVFVTEGREYLVKYEVGERTSYLENKWRTYVWVEDTLTGEIVSSVIKNI